MHMPTFQSTLSSRRATILKILHFSTELISIHALLTESDLRGADLSGVQRIISIHALLTESDGEIGGAV